MMILAPSILAADFKELGKEIQTIEENGAQYLHFDVMDGMFVPSISFGVPVLESIRPTTKLVCDAPYGDRTDSLCGSVCKSRGGFDHGTPGGL